VKAGKHIHVFVAALVLLFGSNLPVRAQRGVRGVRRVRPQAVRPPAMRQPPMRVRRPTRGPLMGRGQIPPSWMNRLQKMSPKQQERFLQNNQRFRNLPPRQRAQIRARLKQWNRLTPEQRQTLIRRAQILERMSPRERQEIRQVILPEWRQLPPNRRTVLMGKLRQLQGFSESEREKRLRNPQFVRGLSPTERELLKQLSQLRVGGRGNL
jgi:hypothetical protein